MTYKTVLISVLGLGLAACDSGDEPFVPDAEIPGKPGKPDAGVDAEMPKPSPEPRPFTVQLPSEAAPIELVLVDDDIARVTRGPSKVRWNLTPYFRNAVNIKGVPGDTVAEKCDLMAKFPSFDENGTEWGHFQFDNGIVFEELKKAVETELKRRGWFPESGRVQVEWLLGAMTPTFGWQPKAISPQAKIGNTTVQAYTEKQVGKYFVGEESAAQLMVGTLCDLFRGTLQLTATTASGTIVEFGVVP